MHPNFDSIRFTVTAEELAAMYSKKADHHRNKAAKCETALAELARSGDLKKAIAAVSTDPAKHVLSLGVDIIDHDQAKTAITATLKHHKREADMHDWLAAHVDKAARTPITIGEFEARRLRGIDELGGGGFRPQIMPAMPKLQPHFNPELQGIHLLLEIADLFA